MEDVRFFEELYEVVKQNSEADYSRVIEERASCPYLYHLAESRANLIDWIPLAESARVLEYNAECGALTAKLLEKCAEVTCVAENELCAGIIRERCAACVSAENNVAGNTVPDTKKTEANTPGRADKTAEIHGREIENQGMLRVVLRDDWNPGKETAQYDLILIVGDFWRYAGEPALLKNLLAENGRLIIADANRLGMRYLAGCQEEYRGGCFTGLEGYAVRHPEEEAEKDAGKREQAKAMASDCSQSTGLQGRAAGRSYTRKEYTGILEKAGFGILRFYYPYPDHKFPTCIYSDARLPEQGELIDNLRNFDRDRYQLFEEQYAYDTIIAEGLFGEFSNSFLIEAWAEEKAETEAPGAEKNSPISCVSGDRIIYSKYSDERDAQLAIRTDIAIDASGRKYVCKHALKQEGREHIRHIEDAYVQLAAVYEDSGIRFCPCEEISAEALKKEEPPIAQMSVPEKKSKAGICFPFVQGKSLAERMKQICGRTENEYWQTTQDATARDEAVRAILKEYIRRIRAYGGEVPFHKTPEFIRVFGDAAIREGVPCAKISDIDMIFPNILIDVELQQGAESQNPAAEPKMWEALWNENVAWNIIDYEWTFDFPIPKDFILYRGLYFAYYQILNDTDWRLADLLALADIKDEQAVQFAKMEEGFQAYLGKGALPMRAVQRRMGTKVLSLRDLAEGGSDGEAVPESEWIKVRKIRYHIDRQEYQDGSVICCGWAFARTKDGRNLPVNIRVTDERNRELSAQVHRTLRSDVAKALKVKNVTRPKWGFDCVWVSSTRAGWKIHFSLGNREVIYEAEI